MIAWVKHVLWLLGAFVLVLAVYHWEHVTQIKVQTTFNFTPEAWVSATVSFVLGVYLSLLFMKGQRRTNLPLLLCVCLPCMVLNFYMPLALRFRLPDPFWITQLDTYGFVGIVSGISFVLALFGSKR